MALTLKDNKIGVIAYTVYVDGEEVATVEKEDPVEYMHGGDNIVPGLEQALAGKKAGDTFDVTVPPEDAYGEYDADAVIEVDRDDFDFEEEDAELQVGMEVDMMDEDGDILEGVILEIQGDTVLVDMNPPLAGKTVRYAGEVLDVREPTEEEAEWGFPESLLEDMFGDEDYDEE